MANFAALVPLIEGLMQGGSRTPFRHFASPIGPQPQGTPDPTTGRRPTPESQGQFQQRGATSRAFFGVQRGKADAEAIAGLGKFTKVAVSAAKPLLALAAAKQLATLPHKIAQWGESLIESQRHLGQFSGTIARSLGEFERRKILRNIGTAHGTAGSTKFLTESVSNLNDTLVPLKISIINLTNVMAGVAATTASLITPHTIKILKGMGALGTILGSILEIAGASMETQARDLGPFQKFLEDAKEGKWPIVRMPPGR